MRKYILVLTFLCFLSISFSKFVHHDSREVILHNINIDTREANEFHNDENRILRESKRDQLQQEHQFLLHVGKPLTSDEKKSLEQELDVKLDIYIPQNTYLLVSSEEIARRAQQSNLVLWVGDFAPEFKIASDLYDTILNNPKLKVTLFPKDGRTMEESKQIAMEWKTALEKDVEDITVHSEDTMIITFRAKSSRKLVVDWVSNQPQSHFLESTKNYISHNSFAKEVIESNVNVLKPTPFVGPAFDGSTQLVGLADSGVYINSCFFTNGSAVPKDTTNLNAYKFIRYSTTYSGGDQTDYSGHGTSVAGTILGINSTSINNGITSKARLHFTDIQAANTNNLTPPAKISDLFTIAENDGVNIYVLPFGSNGNKYDTDAVNLDSFQFSNQDFLAIVSSGNDASSSLSSFCYSKNSLCVGASMSSNDGIRNGLGGASNLFVSDHPGIFGTHMLANFSSVGPTSDGRIKPDIVAPGQSLMTASKNGDCVVSSVKGTSYAAGVAAAAAALVRGYFVSGYYPEGEDPSFGGDSTYTSPPASLVKAVIINSGQQIMSVNRGQGGLTTLEYPSGSQGYGRIQLDKTVYATVNTNYPDNTALMIFPSLGDTLSTGETNRICAIAMKGYLKATLVWTDKESVVSAGRALVNDLDLVVIDINGIEYRSKTSINGFDQLNNVEQVEVEIPLGPRSYAIYVHGRTVPVGPQTYHVVVSGTIMSEDCSTNFGDVCPNNCNGEGTCNNGVCTCNTGYSGVDCSVVACPFDGQNMCSGSKGYCNFLTSTCECFEGFGGPACAAIVPTSTGNSSVTGEDPTGFPETKQKWSDGVVAGSIIAAFLIGSIFAVFLGGYLAVRYLEYRRDKAMSDRATREEEMN